MTLEITANAMNDMTNRADVPPSNYMILNNEVTLLLRAALYSTSSK